MCFVIYYVCAFNESGKENYGESFKFYGYAKKKFTYCVVAVKG